jgi:hypothetical protein
MGTSAPFILIFLIKRGEEIIGALRVEASLPLSSSLPSQDEVESKFVSKSDISI